MVCLTIHLFTLSVVYIFINLFIHLFTYLLLFTAFQRIEKNELPIAQSLHNITKWSTVYMRILLNLVKVPENCYRLGLCKIPVLFAHICLDVFSQKVNNWDTEAQKNSIKLVSDMIEFYDYLYDPLRLWRNHSTNQMLAIDIVVEVHICCCLLVIMYSRLSLIGTTGDSVNRNYSRLCY